MPFFIPVCFCFFVGILPGQLVIFPFPRLEQKTSQFLLRRTMENVSFALPPRVEVPGLVQGGGKLMTERGQHEIPDPLKGIEV